MEAGARRGVRWRGVLLSVLFAFGLAACAGSPNDPPEAQPAGHAYSQQQLDQMLAPIALYPDTLLSQILMASTYPLEVVEAARWSRANPGMDGDSAVGQVQQYDWDPSVKSLTAFPLALQAMDEHLDWTESLGEAFLSQRAQVMDTIQKLRHKAYAEGMLRSNERISVIFQGQNIIIEFANPQVAYVPYYDPSIYGAWWWPDYPPVYWAPWPGYYVTSGFAWGPDIAVATGFFFGTCDWRNRQVQIVNVNNYYYPHMARDRDDAARSAPPTSGAWRHDPEHRRGVPYREMQLRAKYGRAAMPMAPRRNNPEFQTPAPGAQSPGEREHIGGNTGAGNVPAHPETRLQPTPVTVVPQKQPGSQVQFPVPRRPESQVQPQAEVRPIPQSRQEMSAQAAPVLHSTPQVRVVPMQPPPVMPTPQAPSVRPEQPTQMQQPHAPVRPEVQVQPQAEGRPSPQSRTEMPAQASPVLHSTPQVRVVPMQPPPVMPTPQAPPPHPEQPVQMQPMSQTQPRTVVEPEPGQGRTLGGEPSGSPAQPRQPERETGQSSATPAVRHSSKGGAGASTQGTLLHGGTSTGKDSHPVGNAEQNTPAGVEQAHPK